ncbi:receptor-like protein 2 isoform X2 [Prunus avium]|uniref:Receptor-like protein 2 isoform X1 n=1 Tax=Prunus avium TaxID=42229 RepID=A0A6P5SST3_PRUAV|nr:receptor-like protein 2 isoform X1 [Prunus avium]XP_021819905.1 receptor-like protein 2 isoform X2 [Prunus avium]
MHCVWILSPSLQVNGYLLQYPSISCTWKLKPEGQTDKTSIGMVMIKRKDNKATSSKDEKEVPVTPGQRSRKPLLVLLGQWLLLLPYFSSACNQVDHDSLLSLAFKVSSPLNWSGSTDCCLWDGILCNQDDQRVVRLWLPGRGLTGVIPPSITNLTHLTHLNLSHNFLSGPLPNDLFSSFYHILVLDLSYNHLVSQLPPSVMGTLSMLQIVDLSSNFFNGTIPSSFLVPAVAAGSLTTFNVSNNRFSGPIPISLFCTNDSNFNSLSFLDLSFNEFTGQIPPGLGACSKLQVFRAGFNDLSGSLPDDIYDAANLQQLSVPVNQLSGPISNGIMPLANLKILELFSNQFSGPIPSCIGNLSSLENLLVHSNNLTGPLPPSLMYCTNLSTLILRFNSFNGDLSAFNFSKLQLLTTVDLGFNNFTGKLPRSLYSCKSLKAIRLAGNQLQGQISPEIVALESLAFLSISRNNLTNATGAFRILMGCKNLTTLVLSANFLFEPVPGDDSIIDPDGFQNLKVLGLGGCQLTGQLPTWLAKLRNLQVLDLIFNRITGSIPSWLGSLPNLFYINLSNNLLTGGFPKELCQMPVFTSKKASDQLNISYLELPIFVLLKDGTSQLYKRVSNLPPAIYVGNNSLSGNIPVEIGRLKFIHVLDLSHNNFSGSIPNQISYLANLERLDLSYNHLSGEIPSSLKSLHFLSSFIVAYNDLQGLIPSGGGQFDTYSTSSFEGNPGLCGPPTPKRSCHQSPQSPPQVLEVTQRSKTQRILIALIFGIFFGIGFGIGFSMGDKRIPIIGRRRK